MSDVEHRLVTYGTLSPGRSNHHEMDGLLGTWSPGHVRGHLHDEGWGAAVGFPGIVLDPTGPQVEAYLLDSPDLPAAWPRLDEFEGPGYERVVTTIHTADGPVEAYIYALAPDAIPQA